MTHIFIACNLEPPTSTHQAALRILKSKSGQMFVGKMKNSKVVGWVSAFSLHAKRYVPAVPIEGAVEVEISLYYTPPKYLLPKINKCKTLVKTTKPDCDNVVKVILDEFTKLGYWLDDSQVWSLTVRKYWSQQPAVLCTITQNQNQQNAQQPSSQ